jgi:hypothetical protein
MRFVRYLAVGLLVSVVCASNLAAQVHFYAFGDSGRAFSAVRLGSLDSKLALARTEPPVFARSALTAQLRLVADGVPAPLNRRTFGDVRLIPPSPNSPSTKTEPLVFVPSALTPQLRLAADGAQLARLNSSALGTMRFDLPGGQAASPSPQATEPKPKGKLGKVLTFVGLGLVGEGAGTWYYSTTLKDTYSCSGSASFRVCYGEDYSQPRRVYRATGIASVGAGAVLTAIGLAKW